MCLQSLAHPRYSFPAHKGKTNPCLTRQILAQPCMEPMWHAVERGQLTPWLHPLHESGISLCCRYLLPMAGRNKDIWGHAWLDLSVAQKWWNVQTWLHNPWSSWALNDLKSLIQGPYSSPPKQNTSFQMKAWMVLQGQSKSWSSHSCKLEQSMHPCLSANSPRKTKVFKDLEDTSLWRAGGLSAS